MLNIPILSRLKFADYISLAVAIVLLIGERIIRVGLFFVPYSLLDYLRFHFFRGWGDDEIDDLNQPVIRSRTAKEIVENAPGSEGKYKLEEFAVFTPDGYIIILHRLMFNQNNNSILARRRHRRRSLGGKPLSPERSDGEESRETFGNGLFEIRPDYDPDNEDSWIRPPVLMNHGAMMTSEVWLTAPNRVIEGRSKDERIPTTLPHVLLHAGYDVWLMNRRGNKYSCKHTSLSTSSREFWSFSLDEPACSDLPAVVEFIREHAGHAKVSLIGFSQGAAEILASLSMVHGLQTQVNLAVLLAATTRPKVSGFRASIVRTIVKMSPEVVFLLLGRRVMLEIVPFWQRMLSPRFFVHLLDRSMKWMFGWHGENINFEDKVIHYQHLFAYTSVKQIVHWFQIMRARRFQMFDEGPSMKIATGHIPPAYPLHQIKTPLALFEGTADSLQDATLKALPAIAARYTVEGYEHLDFMWAESVQRKVWSQIVSLLNRLESVHSVSNPTTAISTSTIVPARSGSPVVLDKVLLEEILQRLCRHEQEYCYRYPKPPARKK